MALSWYLGNRYVEHLASSGLIAKADVGRHMEVLVHVMVRSSLLSWILAFGVAVFFSHFVAGPIFRFERIMREIQLGDISHRVKIRPHDELQELAREMDSALAEIRRRVNVENDHRVRLLEELQKLADRVRQAGGVAEADAAEKVIKEERARPPEFKIL